MTNNLGTLKAKKVLIVDDEQPMRHLISGVLQRAGAEVIEAPDGETALRLLYKLRPDLVILDVLMPGIDGWEVLSRIRQMTDTPVIMLTVLNGGQNEARALRGGANDYITKPFNIDAFVARAEAALSRRDVLVADELYDDGYLVFDRQRRQVSIDGQRIRLTRKEFELLSYLIRQNGRVCSYNHILQEVWGGIDQSSVQNVHVFVWQLRRKIEPDADKPVYILNEQGVGYYFVGKGRHL